LFSIYRFSEKASMECRNPGLMNGKSIKTDVLISKISYCSRKKCRNTGYAGRIAIHEMFVPDEEIMEMINAR